ncbi:hypothetical protein [Campylobacter helveticus]|uniref:hypothetical protein n=1 Tax=Campylobacter helveticus TaxID=28898 RepID=UPI002149F93D|nr:hypothetical protein [Campylobacter helveticus]MCR2062435.1 hypothetical protein [Campylobacter helveticus]
MKYFFSFLCALFLCACAVKNESQKAQSMQVLITSSSFKINEVGFLKSENSTLSLELYKFAKPFFKLNIKKKICLNGVCYAKKEFNQKYLQNVYYDDFLRDILEAKPLFKAKNLTHNSCGFTQELHHKDSVIKYEVCEGKLHFKDEISGLKIIIRHF